MKYCYSKFGAVSIEKGTVDPDELLKAAKEYELKEIFEQAEKLMLNDETRFQLDKVNKSKIH